MYPAGLVRTLFTALAFALACPAPGIAQQLRQPRVLEILPAADSHAIAENQAFALRLSRPLAAVPHAHCDVEGVRSEIPVRVLEGKEREAALTAAGIAAAPEWLVLRCKSRFPDGGRVSLVWVEPEPAPEHDRNQPEYWNDWYAQAFHFTARSEQPFSLVCSRENEGAGCNPILPVALRFVTAIDPKQARAIHLRDASGKKYRPAGLESLEEFNNSELNFPRLPPNAVLTVHLPEALKDDAGKLLAGGGRKTPPYRFKMAAYPPLVKFAANFGIIERYPDPALPVTLRNLERAPAPADAAAEQTALPSTAAKVRYLKLRDEAKIIAAIAELRGWQARDDSRAAPEWEAGDEFASALKDIPADADTRAYSMLKSSKGAITRALPKPLGEKPMEVVGLPLPEPGFYLVEAESRKLGRSLLGQNKPMYVRTGALVTNLAAHLHYSAEQAMIWVTSLSRGEAVAGAKVSLRDCKGKLLGEGNTDAKGVVLISAALPQDRSWGCPLFAFARKHDELTFARSDWTRGIESWRFRILEQHQGRKLIGHTVLARNLLRPDETVHMKHFARAAKAEGLAYPNARDLPRTLAIVHEGGKDRYNLPVTWDNRGNAETLWKLPAGAKRGLYTVDLGAFGNSATFRVADFRLPVLKAEVNIAKTPLIAPETVGVDVRLSYLSGGAAGKEQVMLRHRLAPAKIAFPAYPDHLFGEGINRWSSWYGEQEAEDIAEAATPDEGEQPDAGADQGMLLGPDGSGRATITLTKAPRQPKTLIADMEYRDPNGETYTAQARATLWTSAQVVGIKTEEWAAVKDKASAEILVLDVNGKPVANAPVVANASLRGWVAHRKRTVGGFYAYHHEEVKQDLGQVCAGKTDKFGVLVCRFPASGSGELLLRAGTTDPQGREARSTVSFWIYSGDDSWFRAEDHDRIDLLPEKKRYEPGETARLQLRMPFREATALVTVKRSGRVLDYFVRPVTRKNPVIELPVGRDYAPNIYVSALLVRGRVAAPPPTAMVDLAKPAFKLGIAEVEVGAKKHEMKVAVSADKAVYQTREKAKVRVRVEGAIDAGGKRALPAEREVAVFALDEALLELMPNDTWNVLAPMMAKRGYGFDTASAQMQVVGKRHYGRKALPPGGGGGRLPTRELFDTLLLWQGKVQLDDAGEAEIEVPLNDSLTRFRIVAVADGGPDQFGLGYTSVSATRDLQILSGLPPVVRDGDQFAGQFTVRNTTEHAMRVKAAGSVGSQALSEQALELAPGQSKGIAWRVTAPSGAKSLEWKVDVAEPGGRNDAIKARQGVEPALSTVHFLATGFELKNSRTLHIDMVENATPGRSEVLVSVNPQLGTSAASVRDYMRGYPFACLEQRTSKAISLMDKGLWAIIADGIERYIAPSGMVNYYPEGGGEGYDVLTSFVLSASHEAGWELPEGARDKMLHGLAQFVEGRIVNRYDYYRNDSAELTERKLLALEALSRFGQARPQMADSLKLDLKQLSNRALIEWAGVLGRTRWPQREEKLKAALAELNQRYDFAPAGAQVKRGGDNRWWLMYSDEVTLIKFLLLALQTPQLAPDVDSLARGAVSRQHNGHWSSTQANVWGSLALDKYARYLQGKNALGGKTLVRLGKDSREVDWSKKPFGDSFKLPLAGSEQVLVLEHHGGGVPFVQTLGTAFAPLRKAVGAQASISKTITPVKQARPGVWSAGDMAKVRLEFVVEKDGGWLVVSDPVPAGATILGGGLRGLGGKTVKSETQKQRWWRSGVPVFTERTFSFYRAYYEYLPRGTYSVEYELRLNNPGRFLLPPTHLEAMYAPDMFADTPNAVLEVK